MDDPRSFNSPLGDLTILGERPRDGKREAIFLGAQILFTGARTSVNARVRNISEGGMMVDSTGKHTKGQTLVAIIKGVGEVTGKVVWITENRIGIAFDEAIDPKLARLPVSSETKESTYNRPYVHDRRPGLSIR